LHERLVLRWVFGRYLVQLLCVTEIFLLYFQKREWHVCVCVCAMSTVVTVTEAQEELRTLHAESFGRIFTKSLDSYALLRVP